MKEPFNLSAQDRSSSLWVRLDDLMVDAIALLHVRLEQSGIDQRDADVTRGEIRRLRMLRKLGDSPK